MYSKNRSHLGVSLSSKRVNFNIQADCHALLKSVCAIKRVSLSEYCYSLLAKDFAELVRTDPRIRHMLVSGDYPPSSNAHHLKKTIMAEFPNE